jgi:hypothetical protein
LGKPKRYFPSATRRDHCFNVALPLPATYAVDLETRNQLANYLEGTQMSKKQKQSRKVTKSSKRTEVAAKPEDEIDTDSMSASTEVPQATPATQEVEVAVEPQHTEAVASPTAQATPATRSNPATRSEAARANIKEGLRLHQIAGRPTKQQLILVFGKAGYLLTWPSELRNSASPRKLSRPLWQMVSLLCHSPLPPGLLWRKQKRLRKTPLHPWPVSSDARCTHCN